MIVGTVYFFCSICASLFICIFWTMAATIMETSNRISNETENTVWIYCASNLSAINICWPSNVGKWGKKRTKSWMCLQKSLSQQNIFRCFLCTKCFICVAISCFSALNDNSIFVLEKEEHKFKHIIQTHTHTNVHVHQIKTIFKIKLPYCKRMRDSSEFCNYVNTIFVEQFLFVWGTM